MLNWLSTLQHPDVAFRQQGASFRLVPTSCALIRFVQLEKINSLQLIHLQWPVPFKNLISGILL
jgi:hypothetical protein